MLINIDTVFPAFIVYSDIEFYLTGSRFWGNNTVKSDWDFFTEYSETTLKYLTDKGFKQITETIYEDIETVLVMKKDNIDIQLVKNSTKKLKAQMVLKTLFPNGFSLKYDTKNRWNAVLSVL